MAGIKEAFEKFSDRLEREESRRYYKNKEGDYVEYLPEQQDPYPFKFGPLTLGGRANISAGKYSPNEYVDVSRMDRDLGLKARYDIPNSGIALMGNIGDIRSSQLNKLNLPFNPMTGEEEPYSESMKNVYEDRPYSIGAQYNPRGTNQLFSALYNKGGGYNLGYNQGPYNVNYSSDPNRGDNVRLGVNIPFAEGGVASMFREREGYQAGGGADASKPDFRTTPSPVSRASVVTGRETPYKDRIVRIAEDYQKGDLPYAQQKMGEDFQKNLYKSVTPPNMNPIVRGGLNMLFPFLGYGLEYLSKQNYSPFGYNQIRNLPFDLGNPANMSNDKNNNLIPSIDTPAIPTITTPQINPNTNSLSESLRMAGFTEEEIIKIIGQGGFANGGRVSMSNGGLTNTIPPVKGPDSQGVETLFKRRYN